MDQDNPLAPMPQPVVQSTLPFAHSPLEATMQKAHSAASAQVTKLTEARNIQDHMRTTIEGLAGMGDSVTPEDVIKGAGSIVSKGGDAMALAGLLADMPQGGQALSSWLAQNESKLQASEQQLNQQLALARHDAGSAALHLIAMQHIGERFGAGVPASQPNVESTNALN